MFFLFLFFLPYPYFINTKNFNELFFNLDKLGILFIYISTDYVFDGKNAPYKPNDAPNPLNKYGLSKLNGEIVTKEVSSSLLI